VLDSLRTHSPGRPHAADRPPRDCPEHLQRAIIGVIERRRRGLPASGAPCGRCGRRRGADLPLRSATLPGVGPDRSPTPDRIC